MSKQVFPLHCKRQAEYFQHSFQCLQTQLQLHTLQTFCWRLPVCIPGLGRRRTFLSKSAACSWFSSSLCLFCFCLCSSFRKSLRFMSITRIPSLWTVLLNWLVVSGRGGGAGGLKGEGDPHKKNPATVALTVFIYTHSILVLGWSPCESVCVSCTETSKPGPVPRVQMPRMPRKAGLALTTAEPTLSGAFCPHPALQEGSLGVRHAHLRSKLMSESVHVNQGCGIGTDRPWPSFQLSLQLWILMLLPCRNFPCPFLQPGGSTSFPPISCAFLFRKPFYFFCCISTSITVQCLNLVSALKWEKNFNHFVKSWSFMFANDAAGRSQPVG